MAVGDTVESFDQLANNATKDIRPTAGNEWTIHAVYAGAACQLTWENSDGTSLGVFDSKSAAGAWLNYFFEVTNSRWLRVKNNSGGTANYAYSGKQTK